MVNGSLNIFQNITWHANVCLQVCRQFIIYSISAIFLSCCEQVKSLVAKYWWSVWHNAICHLQTHWGFLKLLVAFHPRSFVSMWPTNFHCYQSGSRQQPPVLWTCRWSRQVSQSNFNLFIECWGGMVPHYPQCNRVTALQASRSAAAREIPWQPE